MCVHIPTHRSSKAIVDTKGAVDCILFHSDRDTGATTLRWMCCRNNISIPKLIHHWRLPPGKASACFIALHIKQVYWTLQSMWYKHRCQFRGEHECLDYICVKDKPSKFIILFQKDKSNVHCERLWNRHSYLHSVIHAFLAHATWSLLL